MFAVASSCHTRHRLVFCAPVFGLLVLGACTTDLPIDTTVMAQTAVVHQHQATIHASLNNMRTREASRVHPNPSSTRPPATAQNTPEATPSSTPTQSTPEPTPSSTPTQGIPTRPSYDPAAEWGPGHTRDDFDDPLAGLFPSLAIGSSRSWYGDDGRFHISETARGRYVWFWTFASLGNFYVDVIAINGPRCNARDSVGLVFRGDQEANEGYLFGVTCSGHFLIGFKGGPNPTNDICSASDVAAWHCSSLATLHQSEYISPGPDAMNRIGILARDDLLDFYINSHWVFRVSTDDFADFASGSFALYLGTSQESNAEAGFEDFNLWSVR